MACYIHHVPGRLRVKSPAFKNNRGNAEAVKELLRAVDGVTGAEVNSATGSVVVHYDRSRVRLSQLLGVFVANEYIDLRAPLNFHGLASGGAAPPRPSLIDAFAERVGTALVNAVLGKLLPRPAAALLGALTPPPAPIAQRGAGWPPLTTVRRPRLRPRARPPRPAPAWWRC